MPGIQSIQEILNCTQISKTQNNIKQETNNFLHLFFPQIQENIQKILELKLIECEKKSKKNIYIKIKY